MYNPSYFEPSKEGGWASKLIHIIRQQGYNLDVDFHYGVVTSPYPDLRIRLNNWKFDLDRDDFMLLENLTRHRRVATITHVENAERDLGDKVERDYCEGDLINDDKAPPYTKFKMNYVELQFDDVLKEGDRVIVASFNKDQEFVVLDRVVAPE